MDNIIDAEVIPEESLDLAKAVGNELKKFDAFEARINELKEKYGSLVIKDANDKEGYKEVKEAIADLRGIRTGTAKDKTTIKKPFLDACDKIERKSEWIIEEVSKIEKPLKDRKAEIDKEIEDIKAARKAKEDAVLIERTNKLLAIGVKYNGVVFSKGDIEISTAVIRSVDDEIFNTDIFVQYKALFDEEEKVRLEEERKEKEAKDRFEQEQEKFRKEREELQRKEREFEERKAREEIARKAKEAEEERERKAKAEAENEKWRKARDLMVADRIKELLGIGLVFSFNDNAYIFENVYVPVLDVTGLSKEKWDGMIVEITPIVADLKIKAEEKRQAKFREDEEKRQSELKRREEEAAARAVEIQKEKERLAEVKRLEAIEAGKDKGKWQDLMEHISKVPVYSFGSGQYRTRAKILYEKIEEIKDL